MATQLILPKESKITEKEVYAIMDKFDPIFIVKGYEDDEHDPKKKKAIFKYSTFHTLLSYDPKSKKYFSANSNNGYDVNEMLDNLTNKYRTVQSIRIKGGKKKRKSRSAITKKRYRKRKTTS